MQTEQKIQALIRLKRPLEDSPSDTLILNCSKKLKVENTDGAIDSMSTVLKFSGTQNSQNDCLKSYVTSIRNGVKETFLQKYGRNVDIAQKLRREAEERSKNERYKIVNYSRSNLAIDDPEDCVTVLDIELEKEVVKSESDKKYVYDIYYADAKVLEEVDDYEMCIIPTTEVFDSDDVYHNDSDASSEDSNAENYYTNDYPDESDVESVNEDDMIESMNKCEIDDLSSTDDGYVHYDEDKDDYLHELQED